MPRRLPIPTERVSWRIDSRDLDLLRAAFGEGQVTEKVREIVGVYCGMLRERLGGTSRDCEPSTHARKKLNGEPNA